ERAVCNMLGCYNPLLFRPLVTYEKHPRPDKQAEGCRNNEGQCLMNGQKLCHQRTKSEAGTKRQTIYGNVPSTDILLGCGCNPCLCSEMKQIIPNTNGYPKDKPEPQRFPNRKQ